MSNKIEINQKKEYRNIEKDTQGLDVKLQRVAHTGSQCSPTGRTPLGTLTPTSGRVRPRRPQLSPRPTAVDRRASALYSYDRTALDPNSLPSQSQSALSISPAESTRTMSVTTTSNPVTYASAAVLRDYELTHSSSSDSEPLDTSLNNHPPPPHLSQSNPAHWPTDHRRVPEYRPVNAQLDQSERRVYQNSIERAFLITMFTGVYLESVSCGFCDQRVENEC